MPEPKMNMGCACPPINPCPPMGGNGNNSQFKEAVCIDTRRIYDSCSDKDCLEDLQVYFTDSTQPIIDQAHSIKAKSAEILSVFIDVESVPFNKGFYSVDMTFFFCVKLSVYTCNMTTPGTIYGLATFTKKVILYGSEGNVKVYTSETPASEIRSNMPIASVSCVEPIVLAARLCECPCGCECHLEVPEEICNRFSGNFTNCRPGKCVYVTIGMFTIVQLERNVQMMIPAYDFCIPDKECVTTTDDPCEVFKKIKFPTSDFFPPRESEDCYGYVPPCEMK